MNIRLLCLGALCLRSGTGYDIKKLFESAFSHFQSASFGSIYPALAQLERDGLVTHHNEPGARHPERKVFEVTEPGRTAFAESLASIPATEQMRSDYMGLVFFAHLLSTETLQAKLAEIEAFYQSELEYLVAIRDWPGQSPGIHFTIEQGIAVYRAKLAHLRSQGPSLLARHREAPTPPPDGLP